MRAMPGAFSTLVARRLGLAPAELAVPLVHARATLGRRSYAMRAAAFTIAVSRPAAVLPEVVRRRAVRSFTGPLLQSPAALNVYCAQRPWILGDGCAGLVQESP